MTVPPLLVRRLPRGPGGTRRTSLPRSPRGPRSPHRPGRPRRTHPTRRSRCTGRPRRPHTIRPTHPAHPCRTGRPNLTGRPSRPRRPRRPGQPRQARPPGRRTEGHPPVVAHIARAHPAGTVRQPVPVVVLLDPAALDLALDRDTVAGLVRADRLRRRRRPFPYVLAAARSHRSRHRRAAQHLCRFVLGHRLPGGRGEGKRVYRARRERQAQRERAQGGAGQSVPLTVRQHAVVTPSSSTESESVIG